jgi:CheY-like chemotaxis protein
MVGACHRIDRMWNRTHHSPPPTIELVRKHARILVIDDQKWPVMPMFERDGYHIERWAEIKNLPQLTDSHYQLIILDIHGVGIVEDPSRQGIGILDHIKSSNPAQTVIVYSAQSQKLADNHILNKADSLLDKKESYLTFKAEVDRLLIRRVTPGYFISVVNSQLGESAELAPKAVSKTLAAFKRGDTRGLDKYLKNSLSDLELAQLVVSTVSVGIETIKLFGGTA